jgi:short-subunit dehydrogenase
MPDQVVFITGASSGIGYASALAFARQGSHVAVTARRSERLAELERAVNALPAPHGDILSITADVTDAEAMKRAVEQTVQRFGRLDILVANAGVGYRGSLIEADWHDLETLLHTNIEGVLHSVRAAVPAMKQNGSGQIIFISSVTYNTVMPYAAIYGASKAFVSSLARSLRLELAEDHIFVTDMLIGRTESEFSEKRLGKKGVNNPFPRPMPVERVAEAIVRASQRHPKTMTVRPIDRLIVTANLFLPELIGKIAARQYR